MKKRVLYYFSGLLILSLVYSFYEYHRENTLGKGEETLPISDRESGKLGGREKIIRGIPINVNLASSEEISHLPGISMNVAREIVKEREIGGSFHIPSELLRVKGIKKKKLEMILPFIEF